MELALKRLEGVDKVAISIPRQMFAVFYKPEASFIPKDLREAVGKADVRVLRFHVSAHGQVQQEDTDQFFVAGKNRFRIVDSSPLPTDQPVGVMGTVDDSTDPLQLKVDDYKLLEP